MKKNKTIVLFGLILLFEQSIGQDFKKQFNDFFYKKDTVGQLVVLKDWEKSNRNDAELYVAYFNYYTTQSEKEILKLGQDPTGDEFLQLMDLDSNKTDPVGFIYSEKYYDDDLLNKGLSYIDKGIEKFPNRLDMRFGKIYMLGQVKNYEYFTKEIIKTIDYSSINNNKWTWTNGAPFKNAKEEMLGSIQGYQLQLYNTEDDNLLDNMKLIAEAVLKNYPDNVESMSNLSIVYMIKGEYDNALKSLLKANKINPKDCIVLNNIAHAYKIKGEKDNAIKYYKLAFKYGDDETKSYAQKQIIDLRK